jgi:hypothetical protein
MFCNCGYKAIIANIAQPPHYRLQTAFIVFHTENSFKQSSGFQSDLYFIYD